MLTNEIKCPRCLGRKQIYQITKNGFSHVDSGGLKVDCRECGGTGLIKVPNAAVINAVKKSKHRKQKEESKPAEL